MADHKPNDILHHVRKLAAGQLTGHLPDGELLDRFVRHRDEAAFAALVERHGAMVRSVCRRLLRHDHDADDACQAAFLVPEPPGRYRPDAGAVPFPQALPGVVHSPPRPPAPQALSARDAIDCARRGPTPRGAGRWIC